MEANIAPCYQQAVIVVPVLRALFAAEVNILVRRQAVRALTAHDSQLCCLCQCIELRLGLCDRAKGALCVESRPAQLDGILHVFNIR